MLASDSGARSTMDEDQRSYLLGDWREFIADVETDFDRNGRLTSRNVHFIHHGRRLIAWLEGGPRPGAETREFLEERLAAFKKVVGFDRLAYEHDAITAAIEELR
jgi:hypothetical protein